jgi:sugar O-acyltransferase (sialic acid O-acetyltransferase NeuD family)
MLKGCAAGGPHNDPALGPNESERRMDKPLVILGSRTYAEEVYDLTTDIPGCRVEAFIENWDRDRCAAMIDGLSILWIDRLGEFAATHEAICALTTTQRAGFVEQARAHGIPFARLVHPTALISKRARIGEGCIINRGAQIATQTVLGRHVVVSRGALIGHHTTVDDFCTIQPGANVAGAVRVGQGAYIGMGAVILETLNIGAHSVIGAGAVVTRDVPDHVQVVGVPARVVREGIVGK